MRPHLVLWLDALAGPGAGELFAPNYVVLLCAAFLFGGALAIRIGFAHGLDMRRGLLALACGYVGALGGARLLAVLVRVPEALAAGDWRVLLGGGLAAYGGFLGGMAAVWLALGRRDFLGFADACAPTLGFGTFLTRLGCFLAGCDYGTVSGAPWAVRFPPGSPAFRAHAAAGWVGPFSTGSLAVHPTQLYEAALGLALGVASLVWLRRRRGRALDGRVFLAVAALYAAGRFCVESFRGDLDRGLWWGVVSTSQLVSAGVLAVVAVVAWRRFGGGGAAPRRAAPAAAAAALPLALAAALATLAPAAPARAAVPAVAIVDRTPSAPAATVRTGLLDLVADAIGTGHVMAPITVRSLVTEKGIDPAKTTGGPGWGLVATLLGVDLVVAAGVTLDGAGAGFATEMYDRKGTLLYAVDEPCAGCSAAQLEEAARALASRLADAIGGKPPGPPAGPGAAKKVEPVVVGPGPGKRPGPGSDIKSDWPDSTGPGPGPGPGAGPGPGPGPESAPVAVAVAPSEPPYFERHPLALRLGAGVSFVIGRKTVTTLGYDFLAEVAYALRAHTEVGGLFGLFLDADAKRFTFAGTVEWKLGRSRNAGMFMGGSIGVTHVVFDIAPKSVTAFDARIRFGWEGLLGEWFALRIAFGDFYFLASSAFGLIPAWEPKVMLSYRR